MLLLLGRAAFSIGLLSFTGLGGRGRVARGGFFFARRLGGGAIGSIPMRGVVP